MLKKFTPLSTCIQRILRWGSLCNYECVMCPNDHKYVHMNETQLLSQMGYWSFMLLLTVDLMPLLSPPYTTSSATTDRTCPLRRTFARSNFFRCLTRGFRCSFFLFGVKPLFLAICSKKGRKDVRSQLSGLQNNTCFKLIHAVMHISINKQTNKYANNHPVPSCK